MNDDWCYITYLDISDRVRRMKCHLEVVEMLTGCENGNEFKEVDSIE